MGFWHCALYLAVIGLASSAAALLPRRWFHADRFPFRPQRWEHEGKIYEKLAVQRWKDKLPDMSRFLPWLTQKQVSASISAAQAEAWCRNLRGRAGARYSGHPHLWLRVDLARLGLWLSIAYVLIGHLLPISSSSDITVRAWRACTRC